MTATATAAGTATGAGWCRALTITAVMVALVASSAGCEYASRKQQSQLLVDAVKRLEALKTGKGAMTVAVNTEKAAPGLVSVTGPRSFTIPPVAVQLSFADRRASAAPAQTAAGATPAAVFDSSTVYFQHPGSAAQQQSQFGFRSWSKLDFAKVGRRDTNVLGTVNAVNPINPSYLVRLLAGTLSGSVKRIGNETIGATPTTHYEMNVDAAKAFSRLGDKDRQAVAKAFKSDNVKGSVYKHAETWIDENGVPRRLVIRLRQQLDPEVIFGITYTIDLGDFGSPVDIHAPSRDATADVTTLNALIESVRS